MVVKENEPVTVFFFVYLYQHMTAQGALVAEVRLLFTVSRESKTRIIDVSVLLNYSGTPTPDVRSPPLY